MALPRFVRVHYILCKTMHSTWICARLPYYMLSGPWVSCKWPAVKQSVMAVVLFMQGRVPSELLDSQVDPASFEISGHIIMKRQQDYDGLTQEAIWDLLSYASLSEEAFIKFSHFALDY